MTKKKQDLTAGSAVLPGCSFNRAFGSRAEFPQAVKPTIFSAVTARLESCP
jgi:hypothetical protein